MVTFTGFFCTWQRFLSRWSAVLPLNDNIFLCHAKRPPKILTITNRQLPSSCPHWNSTFLLQVAPLYLEKYERLLKRQPVISVKHLSYGWRKQKYEFWNWFNDKALECTPWIENDLCGLGGGVVEHGLLLPFINGCWLCSVPTTVMAMVDSSVGGKLESIILL
jgi:hypothetical protein